jgi:hypothetical protein
MASEPGDLVSLPPDAALQEQPQPVTGEVAEAMAHALDLRDQQVDGLGGPLEQPSVAWKARISASQTLTVRASRDTSATTTPSAQR